MIFSWETSKHPKSNQEPSKMSKIKSRKPNRNSMDDCDAPDDENAGIKINDGGIFDLS